VLAEGLSGTNLPYNMAETKKPQKSLSRMSTVGCILAVLFVGIVLLVIYYFR
jgi:hypothetical protein